MIPIPTLVIVPCGQAKIWHKQPHAGAVQAKDAYTGGPFKLNRAYAERFASHWVVLSAKYGFIPPDFMIPGLYNVTFKRKNPAPVAVATLREQIEQQRLYQFNPIIVLGEKEYQSAVRQAFQPWTVQLIAPFTGLPIGKAMHATKTAIANGVALQRG